MTQLDVLRLQQFDGIVRNRLKIQSTINNAQKFIQIQKEYGSFHNYLATFFPDGYPIVNNWTTLSEVPSSTPLSDQISNDMKIKGFKFFGSTICYAFLQAVGYVDDHLVDCICRKGIIIETE